MGLRELHAELFVSIASHCIPSILKISAQEVTRSAVALKHLVKL